jgi:hypothetical protein
MVLDIINGILFSVGVLLVDFYIRKHRIMARDWKCIMALGVGIFLIFKALEGFAA